MFVFVCLTNLYSYAALSYEETKIWFLRPMMDFILHISLDDDWVHGC